MWLIPKTKNSRFSRFVPDTEDSNSECPEHWQTLCDSLRWRSKLTPQRTWLRRLRKAGWVSKLCGRILKPSRRKDFEDALISSLPDFPVSHFRAPDYAKEPKMIGIYGRILNESLPLFGRDISFLKTSRGCSPHTRSSAVRSFKNIAEGLREDWENRLRPASWLDSPDTREYPFSSMSHTDWKLWVTRSRRNCLQRRKSVRHTDGSDCLYWRSPVESEGEGGVMENLPGKDGHYKLRDQVNWSTPTISRGGYTQPDGTIKPKLDQQVKSWPTPKQRDYKNPSRASSTRHSPDLSTVGQPPPDNPSTNGKNQGLWTTPCSDDTNRRTRKYAQGGTALSMQAKGKLNPAWVEQLMGLPVGWTDLGLWETACVPNKRKEPLSS